MSGKVPAVNAAWRLLISLLVTATSTLALSFGTTASAQAAEVDPIPALAYQALAARGEETLAEALLQDGLGEPGSSRTSTSRQQERVAAVATSYADAALNARSAEAALAAVVAERAEVDATLLAAAWAVTTDERFTVIATGLTQVGKPYRYASRGPNAFDCSGFTYFAWASVGVDLPTYSFHQKEVTTGIDADALRPADLVFWDNGWSAGRRRGHVALHLGVGGAIVHASGDGPLSVDQMSTKNISGYGSVRP